MALQDKVVVVTGGARGMGRAYVQAFLARGAKVAALDLSWKPSGVSNDADDRFYRELAGRDDALMLTCDVTSVKQIAAAYQATIDRFKTVDVLINNVALLPSVQFPPIGDMPILETTDADWERQFAVSLFGTLKVTRAFIRPMLAQQSGSVIGISSKGGNTMPSGDGVSWVARRPGSLEMPYMSAKAALTAMFCYLADEVKEQNVAVNVINPTGARTTGFDEKTSARYALMGGSKVVGAKPEHVVPLALFLAEQDAKTGVSGRVFDTIEWNVVNGFGGPEVWFTD
ncbi:MAG TPA: SDR family oxidoreductase [Chloroflexota bacterium]|jgi:NAD(P)-dependent dehydrogenase (short-subunit alcohol dehydrogenase family)